MHFPYLHHYARCLQPVRVFRVVLMLLVFPCGFVAFAQDAATGAVRVAVVDATGAAIAGAAVSLEAAGRTDAARALQTDRLGEAASLDLPAGSYRVAVHADGFRDVSSTVVAVLGRTVRVQVALAVAGASQTIAVNAPRELLSLDSPLDGNLSPAELADLPIDGRRFQSIAVLAPLAANVDAPETEIDAATGAPVAANDSDNARVVMHATDPVLNAYRIEGLSLTRAFDGEPRGGRTLPFNVPQEAVREFQLRPVGTGDAEGQAAGGAVQVVTKRGESVLHGSAFALVRSNGIGAANPFSVVTHYNAGAPTTQLVQPRDVRINLGGSVGGPLLRNALFGFVAIEGQRRGFDAVSSPSDPNFFALTATQTALLANRGVGTAATARGLAFLDSLTGTVPRRADELALMPRLDARVPALRGAAAGAAVLAWEHVRFRSPSGALSDPVVPVGRASVRDLATHTDTVFLTVATALAARWTNVARVGYSRDAVFSEVPAALQQEPHAAPDGGSPEVSIQDAFRFGSAETRSARRLPDERATELAEVVSRNGRAHALAFGFNVRGVDERLAARNATDGAYDYSSGNTGGRAGGLVDFLTDYTFSAQNYPNGGCPSIFAATHLFCFRSYAQSFGAASETRFHTVEWSSFLRDVWQPTRRVSITGAVRYERVRMPAAQHANAALDAAFGPFAVSSETPGDTNNLAPQLGVAYAVRPSTVVRVGYGYRFGRLPGRMLQAALENTAQAAGTVQIRITPRTIVDPACASVGPNFGYPATYACAPTSIAGTGAATLFARNFQLPALQTGEFSVMQELPGDLTLTASYEVNLERSLPNTADLNIAASTATIAFRIMRGDGAGESGVRNGQIFHVPLYTVRKSAAFGPVTALLSNGSGSYHAGVLQLAQRARRGFSTRVQWTFSKALDTTRVSGATPDQNAQFDPFDPLYDRATSNFDQRNRVVAYAVWQPETHGGTRVRRALRSGWTVAPVFQAHTGRPYSYGISGGTALTGGRESLNGSGGATYLPTVGRNTLHLPWTATLDAKIARTFLVREHIAVKASAEGFNLFNHVNPTTVEGRAFLVAAAGADGVTPLVYQDSATITAEGLTGRPFGVATGSAGSPARERRLQFGLRAEW